MMTRSKSFVAKLLLGAVALAGVAAAVPASAHPCEGRACEGRSHEAGGDWGRDRGWAARGYGPAYYEGYHREWRPAHVVVRDNHERRW